jgi:hypothetical protein
MKEIPMRLAFLLFLLAIMLLVAGAARSDSPDTVTLTREQIEQLQHDVEEAIQRREAAAFQAGRADARARCASLI